MKKIMPIIISIVSIICIISIFAYIKYTEKETQLFYGVVSDRVIPKQFDKIELTIPVVDDAGNVDTQTFSVNPNDSFHSYIKLHVRKNKVIKYEFIDKNDLPSKTLKYLE